MMTSPRKVMVLLLMAALRKTLLAVHLRKRMEQYWFLWFASHNFLIMLTFEANVGVIEYTVMELKPTHGSGATQSTGPDCKEFLRHHLPLRHQKRASHGVD